MGTYTSEIKIEAVVQMSITDSTEPTSTQVTQWITEIEADADARALAEYTLTDQLIDVLPGLDYPAADTLAWLEALAGKRYEEIKNLVLIPPFTPIVSISSLSKRKSSLGTTDDWEVLTEGTTADTDYILLKKRTRTKQYLGFAIYFHHNNPTPGYQRIKMTYNHGWDLDTNIIGEWCTLKVALKVLAARLEAETPAAASDYGIADTRVGIDLERRILITQRRIDEIERKYFPREELGVVLF